jgi:hypothetical protein
MNSESHIQTYFFFSLKWMLTFHFYFLIYILFDQVKNLIYNSTAVTFAN